MRKKTMIRLFVLAVFMSLLWSCRSEDLLTENKETSPSKFKVFTSVKGEKVDYAEGFKILMEKHDSLNNEQHTAKAMKKAFESSKNVSDEYIEFNIRSEDFISESGERWVVYPTVKNSAVTGLIAGILNKDETLVDFRELKPGTPYYDYALPLFSGQYQKSLTSAGQNSKNGKCGFPGQPPCEIDVIVITPTKPDGGGGPWIGGSGGGGGPKGCAKYSNCINPDGGGGGSGGDGLGQPLDPCKKTKNLLENTDVTTKIAQLKIQSTLGKEKGVKFLTDGTPSGLIEGGDHSVDFGVKEGFKGGYHNHTPTGIPMFSPQDVDQLLSFAKAQPTYADNTKNAFVGMVAPNGMHYVMWFRGTYQDAVTTFSQADLDKYSKKYRDRESVLSEDLNYVNYLGANLNANGLEKLFFETLKNMGLEGKINLQRIEGDGKIKNINLGNNNEPVATDC